MSVPSIPDGPRETEETTRGTRASGPAPARRLSFLDGLRGIAIILMVINHTSRWWLDTVMGWPRYYLVYGSVILPAPIFLFLVGFCLPISYHRKVAGRSLDGSAALVPASDRAAPGGARGGGGEGWRMLLVQYARRGAVIIGAGLLLNLLVFRDEPVWSGGVLQTIGFCIIVVAPLMPLLVSGPARVVILGLALVLYLAFALAFPALTRWVDGHEALARVVFFDFPPWPWVCASLIGLVLGWSWLEARRRGPRDEARFFTWTAVVGVASLAAYAAWDLVWPAHPRFGFPRDFILNHHWTPRGVTSLLIVGGVALLLAGTWYVMEVRGVQMPWLVLLGQTALMLYFVHQVIVYTIVNEWLGRRFNNWLVYSGMNVALMILLVYLGRAWLALKAAIPRFRVGLTSSALARRLRS
jgi:uncharacterized membrane protein